MSDARTGTAANANPQMTSRPASQSMNLRAADTHEPASSTAGLDADFPSRSIRRDVLSPGINGILECMAIAGRDLLVDFYGCRLKSVVRVRFGVNTTAKIRRLYLCRRLYKISYRSSRISLGWKDAPAQCTTRPPGLFVI